MGTLLVPFLEQGVVRQRMEFVMGETGVLLFQQFVVNKYALKYKQKIINATS